MSLEPQNLVSIDLSRSVGTVSLLKRSHEGLSLIEEQESTHPFGHSEELFEILETLLKRHALKSSDIHEWWTNEGPGSFTGLRIALAALKGICAATGAKLILVNGSEARARSYSQASKDSKILVVTKTSSKTSLIQVFGSDFKFIREEYVETLPAAKDGEVLLEENWPVRSAFLPLCEEVTIFEGEKLASATPQYYGTSVYTKSAPSHCEGR